MIKPNASYNEENIRSFSQIKHTTDQTKLETSCSTAPYDNVWNNSLLTRLLIRKIKKNTQLRSVLVVSQKAITGGWSRKWFDSRGYVVGITGGFAIGRRGTQRFYFLQRSKCLFWSCKQATQKSYCKQIYNLLPE